MNKRALAILVGIFCIAIFFRFYHLGSVPPSPSLDEVSLGYNAYSILHTGKDEYGTPFPLQLRAYDDFRPALYLYPVVAAIRIFGLNAVAVRAPSVIFSLITIFFIFQSAWIIGKKYTTSENPALWALGFAAISAWHVYISRLGHEVNLGLMLFTAGMYSLIHWSLTKRTYGLYWGALFLALSLYGYQSEKVILPVFGMVFVCVFYRRLLREWQTSIKAGILFGLIALYAVILTLSPQGLSRLKGTSAIGIDAPQIQQALSAHAKAVQRHDRIASVLTSKYVTTISIVANNYIQHFNPLWLASGAQRENHKVPFMGLIMWWELGLMLVGIWYMWRVMPKEIVALMLLWVFTAPIPAAITTQAPHAMRAFTMFPPFMILAGFGAYALTLLQKKTIWISLLFVLLSVGSAYQVGGGYFKTFKMEQSDSFQYALGQSMSYVQKHQKEYTRVIVANNAAGYQSYMFFLFYTQFDPFTYLAQGGTVSGGYAQPHTIGKYTFEPIAQSDVVRKDTLYIANIDGQPLQGRVLQTFTNLDGKPALVAVSL